MSPAHCPEYYERIIWKVGLSTGTQVFKASKKNQHFVIAASASIAKLGHMPKKLARPESGTPPDAPTVDKPLEWCGYHAKRDWPVLKKAPLGVLAIIVIVAAVAVAATALIYEKFIIVNKEGIIEFQAQKLESLKDKAADTANSPPHVQKVGELPAESRERIIAKLKLAYTSDIKMSVVSKASDERSTRLWAAISSLIEEAGNCGQHLTSFTESLASQPVNTS